MSYISYTPPGFTASGVTLTAPTNVNIHPGYTSVSANWSKVNDADQYLVTITGGKTPINQHTNTTNINISSGLEHGTKYSMTIEAIKGGVKGPDVSKYFTTLAIPSPTPSPPPGEECENCTDDASCVSCIGKPLCVDGTCKVCKPNSVITSESACYSDNYICSDKAICEKCDTSKSCQIGYGQEYECNTTTGKCQKVVPPKGISGWLLVVIFAVLLLVIAIITAVILVVGKKPASPSVPMVDIL